MKLIQGEFTFIVNSEKVNVFKRNRTLIEDDPCEGQPKTTTTKDMIYKICVLVQDDRRLKVYEIALQASQKKGSGTFHTKNSV